MATMRIGTLPLNRPFVPTLASYLLTEGSESLIDTTVVLPSTRAGTSLAHALLEASGAEAILLPEITTPARMARDLLERLPEIDRRPAPDRIRAVALAVDLAQVDWLKARPSSAPGHAAALVRLFDELRLAGRDPAHPLDGLEPGDELRDRDADRVAEAWALYRQRIPYDAIDRTLEVAAAARTSIPWPGRPIKRLVLAGFVDLNPTWIDLLMSAATEADDAVLLVGKVDDTDRLISRLLTTWPDSGDRGHPRAPDRRVAASITSVPDQLAQRDERPLVERLADAGTLDGTPVPLLVSVTDPETESRTVTHRIMTELKSGSARRIGVATNDRGLARRVVARLRDAGVDVDDSSGRPLGAEPEGLLIWSLLRCAMTNLAHEPLLELLAHPLTTFGRDRIVHRRRTLRFEKELLRGQTTGADLDGLRGRAREKDEALQGLHSDAEPEMQTLIEDIAAVLEPLLKLASMTSASPAVFISALRAAWKRLAPEADLDDFGDRTDDRSLASRRSLAGVLDDLASPEAALPPTGLGDFAADLSRLIRLEEVRPRRAAFLPVQVTGLLEARLEAYDLLILTGTTEESLPGRQTRALLLGDRWRDEVGLPGWRDVLGQQAELFVRLLRNAPEVMITWPREQNGQPVLPSPLVTRLKLCGLSENENPVDVVTWQRTPPPLEDITLAQSAFTSEPRPPHAMVQPRRPKHLSHSALKTWRECPYRFLLERGFGLKEEDGVIDRMRRLDMGEIVHSCLARFLGPEGDGSALVRAGDTRRSEALLAKLAAEEFTVHAGQLPQRRLWEASFRRAIPLVVAHEIKRAAVWSPLAVETGFEITLGALARDFDDVMLEPDEAALVLQGRIDRIDVRMTGDGRREYAVIDYKTGHAPIKSAIQKGDDLQLAVYAHAVALGGVPALERPGEVVEGAFYRIAADEAGVQGPYYPVGVDNDRDRRSIVDTSLAILRETAHPYVPDHGAEREPKPCLHCAQKDVCRRDERYLSGEVTP